MGVILNHQKPFWSEAELSVLTNIPKKTLQRFRKDGSGPPFVRFGRRTIRYPKDQFKLWLEQNAIIRDTSQI